MPETNDQLMLIAGHSAGGKSASLRNLTNQSKWMYLNSEAGKRLPFKNSFSTYRIEEPYQVHEAFDYAMDNPDQVDGIIIDSLTFLMDMFETQYIYQAADTQKAWGDFAQFFKQLMQQKVTAFGKPVIILAHVKTEISDSNDMETFVPIKGALKNNGVEAYFSTVIAAKKMPVKELKEFNSDLMTITEEEEELGFKYVFQTKLTKKTVGERIRSPMGMFSKDQTFADNDAQVILDHLNLFYG